MATREQVYQALVGLLATLNPTTSLRGDGGVMQPAGTGALNSPVTRIWLPWSQVPAARMPWLCVTGAGERTIYQGRNLPEKRTLTAQITLYTANGDHSQVAQLQYHQLMEEIQALTRPADMGPPGEQTLGGMVTWVHFTEAMPLYLHQLVNDVMTIITIEILQTV